MTLQTMGLPRAAPYTDSVEQLGSRVDSIFDELTRELRDVNFSDLNGQVSDSQVPESAVTQHEGALSVGFSQLTGSIADGQVPESAVTQHEGAIHHGALSGLGDDDHPQYGALAQDETVTGSWALDPLGTGLSESEGYLDIYADSNAPTGHDRGIVFHESSSFRMSMQYDGSGTGGDNLIGMYRNNGTRIIAFKNDGNVVIGTDPGGGGILRVGGTGVFDSGIHIPGAEGNAYEIHPFQNKSTGVAVRATNNPPSSDPIFGVESSGGATRFLVTQASGAFFRDGLRVEDSGETPGSNGATRVRNVRHWGSSSPSAVGIDGTLHTQDA